jgi:hypothetical protein
MKLILEIDTGTGDHTYEGACPCCNFDDYFASECNADRAHNRCEGGLTKRPDWCPLKEVEG